MMWRAYLIHDAWILKPNDVMSMHRFHAQELGLRNFGGGCLCELILQGTSQQTQTNAVLLKWSRLHCLPEFPHKTMVCIKSPLPVILTLDNFMFYSFNYYAAAGCRGCVGYTSETTKLRDRRHEPHHNFDRSFTFVLDWIHCILFSEMVLMERFADFGMNSRDLPLWTMRNQDTLV